MFAGETTRPKYQLTTDAWIGVGLWVISAIVYLRFPYFGHRQWDALMTASTLSRPTAVETRELLFFAHTLVIPLTKPFFWLISDPLIAAGAREAFFAGMVAAMAYWLGVGASGRRRVGMFAAVALLLCVERWRLATGGEEKEIAGAFAGLFTYVYLVHRKWLARNPAWSVHISPAVFRWGLAGLLALAIAVHLLNGALVFLIAAETVFFVVSRRPEPASTVSLADSRKHRNRPAGIVDVALIVMIASIIVGGFFLWLAVGPGGARSVGEILGFFFEYHQSGEFVAAPSSLTGGIVDAYWGGRTFIVGDRIGGGLFEALIAIPVAVGVIWAAWRRSPPVTCALIGWISVLSLHFFFYQPWDPEAWGPSALPWAVVISTALLGHGRWDNMRSVIASLVLLAMAAGFIDSQWRARSSTANIASGEASVLPGRDIARWLDERLPEDATILTDERLIASYFHIYTRRNPIVVTYVDRTYEELRHDYLLTTMSIAFYRPHRSWNDIVRAGERDTGVYVITYDFAEFAAQLPETLAARPFVDTLDLGWGGLWLAKLGSRVQSEKN